MDRFRTRLLAVSALCLVALGSGCVGYRDQGAQTKRVDLGTGNGQSPMVGSSSAGNGGGGGGASSQAGNNSGAPNPTNSGQSALRR